MEKKGLSQEGLKLIACVTMLIDHIGAIFFPTLGALRIIGRLSFPIYCFLLVEGAVHTKHALRYVLRLFVCAVISEIPHDLAFYGEISLRAFSVMVTLLVGYSMLWAMEKTNKWWLKILPIGVAMVLARVLHISYNWRGILVIAVFALTRGKRFAWMVQAVLLTLLFWGMPSAKLAVGCFQVPIQCLGVLALIPIQLYSGRKLTTSRLVQWGFYLFYPAHLLALYLIRIL